MPQSLEELAVSFERIDELAALLGIEPHYVDAFGNDHATSLATKQRILAAMGYASDTNLELDAAFAAYTDRSWERLLEPVLVVREAGTPWECPLTFPRDLRDAQCTWQLLEENGTLHEGVLELAQCAWLGERQVQESWYERRSFSLPPTLSLGYHQLSVCMSFAERQLTAQMKLIIAPRQCYLPPKLEQGGRVFGIATQLYALTSSQRPAGIGTFSDLRDFAQMCQGHGVAAIGLNPLHELDPLNPTACSPYSPSSRRMLHPLYLDLAAIPEWQAEDAEWISTATPKFIDYAAVAHEKRRALEVLYRRFRRRHLEPETQRGADFRTFVQQSGALFARLCLFNVLAEHFALQGLFSWHHWPKEYQDAHSPTVAAFAEAQRERVEFFAYQQWEAERQLAGAAAVCAPMDIGLYGDIAVGVDASSADSWALQQVFVSDIGVGAPPDWLNREGQSWGIVAFSPEILREHAYAEFIDLLRANMRARGAVRIDHAMSLLRLFWIPHGFSAAEGAYVRYPVEDLFAIVALESQRNRCMVIGEDLGTVPPGFRERMETHRIFAYRLALFEREGDGYFIPPERYPRYALSSLGTHDLPPLAGFWTGSDIDVRAELGWVVDRADDEAQRAKDRERLLEALTVHGGLSEFDAGRLRVGESATIPALIEAAYRFVGRTSSQLAMLQLEDIFALTPAINVPGTISEQPNWRRRFFPPIDAIAAHPSFMALTKMLRELRN